MKRVEANRSEFTFNYEVTKICYDELWPNIHSYRIFYHKIYVCCPLPSKYHKVLSSNFMRCTLPRHHFNTVGVLKFFTQTQTINLIIYLKYMNIFISIYMDLILIGELYSPGIIKLISN